ncbi:ABC transporter permease [Paenibacillus sp. GYB004]|uniref:ABC transporter permease n=1 Tax=Paenibacillus sp. GYB004 TaxID=2994393 RepID=UPI002F963C95
MKWKDRFRFVRQNMKKNRSRVFMTVLATAIGCSFLIVLASVGFGLQKSVVADITEGRLLTQIMVHGVKESEKSFRQIGDNEIGFMESQDHVKAVTRRYGVQQSAEFRIGELQGLGQAVVVDMPSEAKAGFELAEGRMPQQDFEIIIGFNFAESMLTPEERKQMEEQRQDNADAEEPAAGKGEKTVSDKAKSLIGKTMNVQVVQRFGEETKSFAVPVTIVGIGKAPSREWLQDRYVYIHEQVMKQIESFTQTAYGAMTSKNPEDPAPESLGQPRIYNEVYVYADRAENVKSIVERLKTANYATYSIVDQLDQVNAVFLIMKIGLILVGTIAVLIASIGIYNTMTMAVTERTPDIGVMKAIGAHPRTIKSVFLIESAYIGIMGAAIGTAVAYAVSFAVNLALPQIVRGLLDSNPPEGLRFSDIPPALTLICVAISLLVAILSGVRPAVRATRVDVLKALRRDI